MATINDVIRGLEIFAKYGGGERHAVNAQHDEIFSGPADGHTISDADLAELDRRGWFIDEEHDAWAKFT